MTPKDLKYCLFILNTVNTQHLNNTINILFNNVYKKVLMHSIGVNTCVLTCCQYKDVMMHRYLGLIT